MLRERGSGARNMTPSAGTGEVRGEGDLADGFQVVGSFGSQL